MNYWDGESKPRIGDLFYHSHTKEVWGLAEITEVDGPYIYFDAERYRGGVCKRNNMKVARPPKAEPCLKEIGLDN